MIRIVLLGMFAMSLSACISYRDPAVTLYTQADVDAINARSQCRALARNLVQVARCDGR